MQNSKLRNNFTSFSPIHLGWWRGNDLDSSEVKSAIIPPPSEESASDAATSEVSYKVRNSCLYKKFSKKTTNWRSQTGVSLIESLIVVVMVAVMVFLMANIPNAMNLISKAKHTSLAREIAAKQIEDKRSISYANLANDTVEITAALDPRMNLLPNGGGTVLVEDCDPNVCTNEEKIKQITVDVNWKDGGKDQKITLKTFIGEGGLGQ